MATNAKEWKKKSAKSYELEVPSGNVCLVRRPGPSIFAELSGSIPNSLLGEVLPLLEEAERKGKTGDSSPVPPEALAELQDKILKSPQQLSEIVMMADEVTVRCVVEPVVHRVPEDGERDEDKLYVDEVDFEDKIFIMNFVVGGTANLERFREGTQELVAAGPGSPEVQGQA